MTSVRVPITNTFAKGGYTARVFIGEKHLPVDLILDSGSSVLSVRSSSYDGQQDGSLRATALVQHVRYGKGGWSGPIVKTSIRLGLHSFSSQLNDVAVALAKEQQQGCFVDADGILGLAYSSLDHAFDISSLLDSVPDAKGKSYPFWLGENNLATTCNGQSLAQCPTTPVTPYFTQLEAQGVVANQFALYTHRSSIYQCDGHPLHNKHLNHGMFVVGKPHLHVDLHRGTELVAKLVHDRYYNLNVTAVQVGSAARHVAPALEDEHRDTYCSNGIIDSGASYLVLPQVLFTQIKQDLIDYNPSFAHLLASFGAFTGEERGIELDTINLATWPEIKLFIQGQDDEEIAVSLSPDTYWQVHAPQKNQASFKLCWLPGWPNQIILGLPVLNNYYTIFDRDAGDSGCIRFVQKREPTHALKETLHSIFNPTSHHQDHQ